MNEPERSYVDYSSPSRMKYWNNVTNVRPREGRRLMVIIRPHGELNIGII